MKVEKILQTRVIQLAKVQTNLGWVPDLLKEIGTKYDFVTVPKPGDLFRAEPNNKAEFKHGRLGTNIIDTLTLFHDGFVVETTTATDQGELFLNHLMQWLKEKVLHLQEVGTFLYLSQLEVSLNLGKFGQVLDSIGNQISQRLVEYGMSAVEPFVFGTLHLAQDPLKQSVPKPGVFGIERRRDVPYAENRFFAQAPLRTEDHKVLLTTLEGVLR